MVDEFLQMVGDYQVVACVMQLGCTYGCNPSVWGMESAACWLAHVLQRPGIIDHLRDVMRRDNVERMLPLVQPPEEEEMEDEDAAMPPIQNLGLDDINEDEEMGTGGPSGSTEES